MALGSTELARRAGGGLAATESWDAPGWTPGRVKAGLATEVILQRILRRGRWSLHRHVHLVAAFEEASNRAPIRRLLSVGSGAALSELYLAATHPDLEVVITDLDQDRLGRATRLAGRLGVANVERRALDLLADPPPDQVGGYDLVIGVEVLEHIEDDGRAAACILGLSRRFVYQLVPHATPAQLADPQAQRRAWERHEHHRSGYTHDDLGRLFAAGRPEWIRTCYVAPDAPRLRADLDAAPIWSRLRHRRQLVDRASQDVRSPAAAGDRAADDAAAAGIEILTRVAHPAETTDGPQAWVRPSGPTNS